ncbi:GNAT family N-acetyltransferase [Demequina muriae]|uniref:GNAT family N-acetyltransferase n=1 Tax=Demequina muriae TaxID=3051664 RepID=A0ABT8GDC3_9MICO|nr:GNAT family N-acetyltransferase [Demequina sp. EGI L300058]MDN4479432.1 GNAT family N-acetyltransferase [Demequina sp. EGI L300058]
MADARAQRPLEAAAATRVASVDDAAVLARLLWDFNTEFEAPIDAVEVLEARLRRVLAGDRFWALLAGDPAAGFVTLAMRDSALTAGPVAYLEDFYVVPELRGRGIGSALMGLLLEEVSRRGIAMVEIGVDEPDDGALRFYERHAFVHRDPETGDRAFYLYREFG